MVVPLEYILHNRQFYELDQDEIAKIRYEFQRAGYHRKEPKGTCDEVYRHPRSKNLFRIWNDDSSAKGNGKYNKDNIKEVYTSSTTNSNHNSNSTSGEEYYRGENDKNNVSNNSFKTPTDPKPSETFTKTVFKTHSATTSSTSPTDVIIMGREPTTSSSSSSPKRTDANGALNSSPLQASNSSPVKPSPMSNKSIYDMFNKNSSNTSRYWVQLIVQSPIRSQNLLKQILAGLPDIGSSYYRQNGGFRKDGNYGAQNSGGNGGKKGRGKRRKGNEKKVRRQSPPKKVEDVENFTDDALAEWYKDDFDNDFDNENVDFDTSIQVLSMDACDTPRAMNGNNNEWKKLK